MQVWRVTLVVIGTVFIKVLTMIIKIMSIIILIFLIIALTYFRMIVMVIIIVDIVITEFVFIPDLAGVLSAPKLSGMEELKRLQILGLDLVINL
jgi:hypothetical protein